MYRLLSCLCGLILGIGGTAQSWDTLHLQDLSAFSDPGPGWQLAAEAQSHPWSKPELQTRKGSGILVNDPAARQPTDLYTAFEHGDMDLELEFLLPPGSNSGIYLQGRYEIQLLDSWTARRAGHADLGAVYGQAAPRQNAGRAPGLWQQLQIRFEAPRFDAWGRKLSNARLLEVRLNGVTIHENLELPGPTAGSLPGEVARGPLRIQGDHGPLALRNIRYQLYNDPPLTWKKLEFEAGTTERQGMHDWKKLKMEHRGEAGWLSYDVVPIGDDLALHFTGKLDLKRSGRYAFELISYGNGRLLVDGKPVIKNAWFGGSAEAELEAGEHTLDIYYVKVEDWITRALGLYISGPGLRRQPLHAFNSIPYNSMSRPILAHVGNQPRILRSFMDMQWEPGGPSRRLTHPVNVGLTNGSSFTYDTRTGDVVQVWRGDFLDASPMWNSRGDGSARPLGSRVVLDSLPALYLPGQTDLRPLGYRLDEEGVPHFRYAVGTATVTDHLQAAGDNTHLQRRISREGSLPAGSRWQLARGHRIEEVEKGLYEVDQRYFIRLPEKADYRPALTKNGNGQVLLLDAEEIDELIYEIVW